MELLSTPVTMTEILEKDLIKEEGEIMAEESNLENTIYLRCRTGVNDEVGNLQIGMKGGRIYHPQICLFGIKIF